MLIYEDQVGFMLDVRGWLYIRKIYVIFRINRKSYRLNRYLKLDKIPHCSVTKTFSKQAVEDTSIIYSLHSFLHLLKYLHGILLGHHAS